LGLKGHNGIDYAARRGDPVYAACDGVVYALQTDTKKGVGVWVITEQEFEFHEQTSYAAVVYFHLLAFHVKEKQKVQIGDLIGWADNTGEYTTGDHLHFGLYQVDKYGQRLNKQNGYGGAVDPLPYTFKTQAKDIVPYMKRIREILARFAENIADRLR
jgi:murein DD-endopeptidase MepM/ murein hydrolase activator NlpD